MTYLREHPTLVLGIVASLGMLINSAVAGDITWTVAVPAALALLIHSFVSPAYPGWIARNGLLLGVLASLAVVGGQLIDGTVTPIAALPVVLGVLAQAYNPPPPDVIFPPGPGGV